MQRRIALGLAALAIVGLAGAGHAGMMMGGQGATMGQGAMPHGGMAQHHAAMTRGLGGEWTMQDMAAYCMRTMHPGMQNGGGNATPPGNMTDAEARAFCDGVMIGFCAAMAAHARESPQSLLRMTPEQLVQSCHGWMMQMKQQQQQQQQTGTRLEGVRGGAWGAQRGMGYGAYGTPQPAYGWPR